MIKWRWRLQEEEREELGPSGQKGQEVAIIYYILRGVSKSGFKNKCLYFKVKPDGKDFLFLSVCLFWGNTCAVRSGSGEVELKLELNRRLQDFFFYHYFLYSYNIKWKLTLLLLSLW